MTTVGLSGPLVDRSDGPRLVNSGPRWFMKKKSVPREGVAVCPWNLCNETGQSVSNFNSPSLALRRSYELELGTIIPSRTTFGCP